MGGCSWGARSTNDGWRPSSRASERARTQHKPRPQRPTTTTTRRARRSPSSSPPPPHIDGQRSEPAVVARFVTSHPPLCSFRWLAESRRRQSEARARLKFEQRLSTSRRLVASSSSTVTAARRRPLSLSPPSPQKLTRRRRRRPTTATPNSRPLSPSRRVVERHDVDDGGGSLATMTNEEP